MHLQQDTFKDDVAAVAVAVGLLLLLFAVGCSFRHDGAARTASAGNSRSFGSRLQWNSINRTAAMTAVTTIITTTIIATIIIATTTTIVIIIVVVKAAAPGQRL
jgi:hypothetical protein